MRITALPRREEQVRVENTSPAAVDLEGTTLQSWPYGYAFGAGTVLQPGETLVLEVRGSPDGDSRLVKHWGRPGPILDDRGDAVSLRTPAGIALACSAWGSAAC